jgi:hypothetical protein
MGNLSKCFSFGLDQATSNDHFTQIYVCVFMYVVISVYPRHMHIHTIYSVPTFTQCTCVKHITVVVLLLQYGKMITYLDHQI